ncbi:uncharacterized protein [Garra rufa]|uniref:uncharacterized protein n=1 Tax=Garra rufa TaxID=137080 RepID=UPI003CCEAC34
MELKLLQKVKTFIGAQEGQPLFRTGVGNLDPGGLQIFQDLHAELQDQGISGVAADEVSVKEGDLVTLLTDVKTNQKDRIRWYLNDTRIAEINGDLSKICTDVQCNEGTEIFRGRLTLDHQTGSLTIRNIRTTDAGDYHLQISGNNSDHKKTFSVTVHDVPAAEQDETKEGENVTLYTGVIKNPNDALAWYFHDVLIVGDQSKVCTDERCKERFGDRLKVAHQTGSLTITNITSTDSGNYQLQINSSRVSIIRNFSLTVPVVN